MLSQQKLLKAIDADMRACRDATLAPTDTPGKDRQILELATLTSHLQWAQTAGDDQSVLEQIVQSLEKSVVVGYQHWRDLSTV
jgi:hypothetical protein